MLSRGYVVKLLRDLDERLQYSCPSAYADAQAKLGGDESGVRALAAIVAIDDHEPIRDLLYADLGRSPLVRHRVYALKRYLESAPAIHDLVSRHAQRVGWHVRRIYRSRNLLLHIGEAAPYNESLVENLHGYFHGTLSGIEELFAQDPPPPSIDAAILRVTLDHRSHLTLLADAGKVSTDRTNLQRFVFGAAQQ